MQNNRSGVEQSLAGTAAEADFPRGEELEFYAEAAVRVNRLQEFHCLKALDAGFRLPCPDCCQDFFKQYDSYNFV